MCSPKKTLKDVKEKEDCEAEKEVEELLCSSSLEVDKKGVDNVGKTSSKQSPSLWSIGSLPIQKIYLGET
jgi:hypothetical protein